MENHKKALSAGEKKERPAYHWDDEVMTLAKNLGNAIREEEEKERNARGNHRN